MPYSDRVTQNAYQCRRQKTLRTAWTKANGPCARCGSTERLQVDHIDPATKVSHRIWSWSSARRAVELAKCQVLCYSCHLAKTSAEFASVPLIHGRKGYGRGCKCPECMAGGREQKRESRLRLGHN